MRAVPIFVLIVIEGYLGSQLSAAGSPYPASYLYAHIGLAILLVLFTGHVFGTSFRVPGAAARASAGITFLAAFGATIAGTVFLLGGGANSAFLAMEGLFGVALVGAILLVLFGRSREVSR
jgi:hypothetical protein